MAADRHFEASALVPDPMLLVATTRKPVNGARATPWYGTERAPKMTVARARLMPPDDGRFSLAPVGLADWKLDKIEPVGQIGDLIDPSAGGHDVLVYVHGYNTSFETAALDAARLSDWHQVRRRHHGVLVAVPGEPARLRLRSRERHVVARRPAAGA
jgi:esterase/lipase superfamily enzyme